MRKSMDREGGSITVEGALSLSIFILAMVSWALVIQLVRLQSLSHHALDQAVLDLSETLTIQDFSQRPANEIKRYLTAHPGLGKGMDLGLREDLGDLSQDLVFRHRFFHYLGKAKPSFDERTQGVRLSVDLDMEGEIVTGNLAYSLKLPAIFKKLGPFPIKQTSQTGIWLVYGEGGGGPGSEEGEDGAKATIWQESPFTRGKIFLDRARHSGRGRAIKPGRGFDLYHGTSLEEIVSLNLFSPSYSKGAGLDPGAYELNQADIQRTLLRYMKKELSDAGAYEKVETEDGGLIITGNKQLVLRVILPEEGEIFRKDLEALAKPLEEELGVGVQFNFLEKALVPDPDDQGDGEGAGP